MIALDTSALIDSLTGPRSSEPVLREIVERGEKLMLPAITLYEWLRGPRKDEELALQEMIVPSAKAVGFGVREAALSARIYRALARPRNREIYIAIAATAILQEAELWTLNPRDFADIPGLRLARL